MGYYAQVVGGELKIKNENLDEAFRILCEINKPEYDHLKGGGTYYGDGRVDKFYSWMPKNYHEIMETAYEIISKLGFDCCYDSEGNLLIDGYDSKVGDEQTFFQHIAHLVEGELEWRGEDDEICKWVFFDGKLLIQTGRLVRQYNEIHFY